MKHDEILRNSELTVGFYEDSRRIIVRICWIQRKSRRQEDSVDE